MKLPHHTHRIAATLSGIAFATICLASSLHANLLVNGGFESPVISKDNYSIMDQSQVAGWKTTATDHKIEIWSTPFNGVSAFEGNQFTELDANMQATLYQDVTGISAGERLTFGLAHRGRVTVEAMRFTITDLGADGIYGTADDTTLFSQVYSDGTGTWNYYTSDNQPWIISKGDTLRVSLESLVPGSVGNLVDGVTLNATPLAAAPEPGTWAALSLLCFASYGRTALRRMGMRKA